jgi:hypothetical protein
MRRAPAAGLASALLAALLLAALLGGRGEARAATVGAAGAGAGLELKTIGEVVEPLYVVAAPGRANRKLLFVVEQRGLVKLVRGNEKLKRPFLDLRKQVRAGGEQGLFSIAFDPAYATNRRLSTASGDGS